MKSYQIAALFFFFILFNHFGYSQTKILNNQIGIGISNPATTLDIRSLSNAESASFLIGNKNAVSRIKLVSGKKAYRRSYFFYSNPDDLVFAKEGSDTLELMRFTGQGKIEMRGPLGLQRTSTDSSIYIGTRAGLSSNATNNKRNVFIGSSSGQNITTYAVDNTFLGDGAGGKHTHGSMNTFIGQESGYNNTEGNNNTFVGKNAGGGNSTGSGNTFLGVATGGTGYYNSSVGMGAGGGDGNYNLFLGARSGPMFGAPTLNNAIAIGYFAEVNCSNCAVFGGPGDNYVDVGIGTNAPEAPLDVRGKVQIQGILSLNAQTNCDNCAVFGGSEADNVQVGIGTASPTAKLDVDGPVRLRNLQSGSGLFVVADEDGNLALSELALATSDDTTPTALKAENSALKSEVETLKSRLLHLENMVQKIVAKKIPSHNPIPSQEVVISNAALLQNHPNPFQEVTNIRYFIPDTVQKAVLKVTDAQGQVILSTPISSRGQGETTLRPFALSSGTYFYSLVLDGRTLETRKMVLTAN